MDVEYTKGYADAIDDVQEAMRLAEVTESQPTFAGGIVFNSYNDPKKFVEELKRLRDKRFN